MLAYVPPAAFRPIVPSPAFGLEGRFLGQVPLSQRFHPSIPAPSFNGRTSTLGRERPTMGQQFDQLLGWHPVFGDLLRLTFHAGTGYFGIRVGLKERGFLKGLAWVLGVGNGLAAIADVVSLIQRAVGTHPAEGKPVAPSAPPAVAR